MKILGAVVDFSLRRPAASFKGSCINIYPMSSAIILITVKDRDVADIEFVLIESANSVIHEGSSPCGIVSGSTGLSPASWS